MSDPKPLSETELVDLCLRGDEAAWAELVRRYQGLVYSVPRRLGLSPEDSSDVFQRVCVLLYQRLGAIRDPARLGGWLITTASRESYRAARRARQHVPLDLETEDGARAQAEPRDILPLADEAFHDLERAQVLRSALAELSERCRMILEEFLQQEADGSYKEIARRLGIPIGSIGPTRARCLAQLRERLRARGIEG